MEQVLHNVINVIAITLCNSYYIMQQLLHYVIAITLENIEITLEIIEITLEITEITIEFNEITLEITEITIEIPLF